jgi:hypothetical protein
VRVLKLALLSALLAACGSAAPGSPAPAQGFGQAHLKYAVIAAAGRPAWCGPPVVRVGEDQQAADASFAQIKSDSATYSEILAHAHPAGTEADAAYRLAVYQEWQVLQHLPLQPSGEVFAFDYQTSDTHVTGSVDVFANVRVTSRQSRALGPCPICLPAFTAIATPAGERPVSELRPGDPIWTRSATGARLAAVVLRTGRVEFAAPTRRSASSSPTAAL